MYLETIRAAALPDATIPHSPPIKPPKNAATAVIEPPTTHDPNVLFTSWTCCSILNFSEIFFVNFYEMSTDATFSQIIEKEPCVVVCI